MIGSKRILVVDDEKDLCEILSINLELATYEVTTANSAEEALEMDLTQFDLILLDVMMEKMSGFDMLKAMKANPSTSYIPVLFLTAKDSENDLLHGFNLGADDYISKPFNIRELLARVKAVLARTYKSPGTEDSITYKGIAMNAVGKSVMIDNKPIAVTRTEFDLLWLLVSNPGKVFSRQELINEVWPENVIVTDRTIDVNITRLRKKLGPYSNSVRTRQGFGYYIE